MQRESEIRRSSNILRMSAAILAAAGVAGCSGDFSRLSMGPVFTASTDNQRAVMGANPEQDIVTGSVQPGRVQTAALAPPVAAAPAGPGTQYRGWTSAGGTTVTVTATDTAATLSKRYGVPEDALLATNNMTSAAQLTPGRHVVIPVYSAGGAPTAVAAAPTVAGTPATHKVVAGDTLLSIARSYGVPASSIAQANNLPENGTVKLGQTLRIPGANAGTTRVAALPSANDAVPAKGPEVKPAAPPQIATGAPPTTLNEQAAAAAAPAGGSTTAPTQVASLPTLAGQAGATATDAAPAAAEEAPEEAGSGFRWPARGRIVAGFGRRPNGEQNDGINIALPEGTPIKAAESGTVIYAGNELTGFGNLVLVRHADGWVTAYAHAREITVTRGAEVRRGQVIGAVGATGAVSQPQLHFELRKGSTPVDPLPHLSGA